MWSHQPLPGYFRTLYLGFRTADLIALIAMTIWLDHLRRYRRLRRAALVTYLERRQEET